MCSCDVTRDVRIETGPAGERLLVVDVTLTNDAPASGLPRYVIGNDQGLPDGTSRMLVTLYGPGRSPLAAPRR